MKVGRFICASVCIATLTGIGGAGAQQGPPNILLLIGDDIGVEQIASFGIGSDPAVTPVLDALAARGIQFSRVWAQPICSPTRATLLTGRYGFRTGVGMAVRGPGVRGPYPEDPPPFSGALPEVDELPGPVMRIFAEYDSEPDKPSISRGIRPDEATLPAQLKRAAGGYATAVFGKWHVADLRNGWFEHPGRAGFDHYSVLMNNEPESYFSWWENVDGVLEARKGYTPERKIDDAIEWIDAQGERPWFLWLAFNLAHYPHHVPAVANLDTAEVLPSDPHAAVDVMISRLDQEIGRLLAAIGDEALENTVVIFVGDNGTTGNSIDPPFYPDKAKFTIYEGGLRVPLIIAGPRIPQGRASDALVNTTDIYSTILELAGARVPDDRPLDSVSLMPYFENPARPSIRDYVYADNFNTEQGVQGGGHSIRDRRYKLVTIKSRTELYDLVTDPYESHDLLEDGISTEEQAAVDRLRTLAQTLHRSAH